MGQLGLLLLALLLFLVVLYYGSIGYREQFLFTADGKYQSDMDECRLPGEMLELFHAAGHELSKSAYAEPVEKGAEWTIRDPILKKEYLAIPGENGVDVYRRILIACLGDVTYEKTLLEIPCATGWVEDLDARRLPQKVLTAFAEHGHFLSPAAAIEISTPGGAWSVEDADQEYHIASDRRVLRVSYPCLRDLVDEKNYLWQWDSVTTQVSRTVLFSANIRYCRDWPGQLDRGEIPEGLRGSFLAHEYPLAPDTAVIAKNENLWLLQECMFGIGEGDEKDLERGIISPNLRQMFAEHGRPLSENAAVDRGGSLVRDRGEMYCVRRQQGALRIYTQGYAIVKDENCLNVCREQEGFMLRRFGWYRTTGDTGISRGESDIRLLSSSAGKFWKKALISAALILPALLATVLMAALLGIADAWCRWTQGRISALQRDKPCRWARAGEGILRVTRRGLDWLPSILAAIPPFVTGVFLIQLTRTDLIAGYNFGYGTLCLAAFNVSYFYKRAQHKLREAYHAPDVLFARSLGINERTIFRRYVFPRVIHGNLVIVRELLPHVVVESIVIEYVFAYGGLLRSALDVLVNYRAGERQTVTWMETLGDWQGLAYIAMVVYLSVLFIAFFAYICRCLEDHFSPQ